MIVAFLSYAPALVSAQDNTEILRAADQARGNVDGVSWQITLTSSGKKSKTLQMDVKARAFDILAITRKPAKNRGHKLLMSNGTMWFHRPGLSKPVPISRRQRLQGQASYGDIASTNYASDYDAVLLGEEIIGQEPCYVFDLTSNNNNNTYDKIKYWVSKDRKVGVKAEYYTISGKLFKFAEMEYENEITIEGKPQPFISAILITDALIGNKTTTLKLDNPKVEVLPDHLFNLNLLRQ